MKKQKKTGKSKVQKMALLQLVIGLVLVALVAVLVLFGLGYLKLGAWYLPTSQITVDTEGIHFYSGNTGSIMWTLESEWRQPISTIQTSGVGNYNFPLPTSSGKFHIYCTASGCDAGEWFLIDLSAVPLSPADTIINGYCLGSYERAYSCSGKSRDFVYQSSTSVPFTFRCNTCTSRNVYDVSGVNTQAVIVSAPPMPTPTAIVPIATTYPPPATTTYPLLTPTQTLISTPTPTPTQAITPAGTAHPVQTETTPPQSTMDKTTPIAKTTQSTGIVVTVVLILAAYYVTKKNKRFK